MYRTRQCTVILNKLSSDVTKDFVKKKQQTKVLRNEDSWMNILLDDKKPLKFYVYGYEGEKRRLVEKNIEDFGGKVVDKIGDTINILKERVIPPAVACIWTYYTFVSESIKQRKLQPHRQYMVDPSLIADWEERKKEEQRKNWNSEDESDESLENNETSEDTVKRSTSRTSKYIVENSSDDESKEETPEKRYKVGLEEPMCTPQIANSSHDKSENELGDAMDYAYTTSKPIEHTPEEENLMNISPREIVSSKNFDMPIVHIHAELNDKVEQNGKAENKTNKKSTQIKIIKNVVIKKKVIIKTNESNNIKFEKTDKVETSEVNSSLIQKKNDNVPKQMVADSMIISNEVPTAIDDSVELEDSPTESTTHVVSGSSKKKKKCTKHPDYNWKIPEIKEFLQLMATYRRQGLIFKQCYERISSTMSFGSKGEKKRSSHAIKLYWLKIKKEDLSEWVDRETANYLSST